MAKGHILNMEKNDQEKETNPLIFRLQQMICNLWKLPPPRWVITEDDPSLYQLLF